MKSPRPESGAEGVQSPEQAIEATIVEKRRKSGVMPAVLEVGTGNAQREAEPDGLADAGRDDEVDDELDDAASPEESLQADTRAEAAPAGAIDQGSDGGTSQPSQASRASSASGERSGARATSAGSQSTQHTATVTPDVAMRSEELSRTRLFLKVAALLAACTAVSFLVMPRTALPVWAPMGGAGLVVLDCLIYTWMLRDERNFTTQRLLTAAYFAMMASTTCILYFGFFSPAPMVYTFGLYFFSLGASKRGVVSIYASCALLHGGVSLLFIMRVIDDPGLIRADALPRHVQLIVLGLVQLIYALTFLLARGSRGATMKAIQRLHEAIIQVQKREALLAEAHQDLDRALKAGYQGRHTDRRLGPYRLAEVIGRGAMGEVYRAVHVETNEPAAVKLLHPDVLAEPAHVRRFFREAEIVSRLSSPHVVRVLSIGTTEPTQVDRSELSELPYIAMELLEGRDLAFHLRKKRRLSPRRVVELVEQCSQALGAAAAADVVHRDLKPQNIFLAKASKAGTPRVWKVLDFGVSKLSSTSGTLTQGAVIGTPGYMAPEQARGGDVGPPADVFALATIAYRALTGRPAFSGSDLPRVLFDVCYTQPAQPSTLAPLHEDVERVLALGMAKQSDDRFQTARELSDALAAAMSDEGLSPSLRERADRLIARAPWTH